MENSPFGELPAELRNTIYELVLVRSEPIKLTRHGTRHYSTELIMEKNTNVKNSTALLQTCKQLRNESRQIFFARNCFELEAWNVGMIARVPDAFFSAIGSTNTSMLRQVQVMCQHKILGMEGRNAAAVRDDVLEKLKEVRHAFHDMPRCKIQVHFKTDESVKEVYRLQALSSQHMVCDLRDFHTPWKEQRAAIVQQIEIWRMDWPHYAKAIGTCLSWVTALVKWRAELIKMSQDDTKGKVADGGNDER